MTNIQICTREATSLTMAALENRLRVQKLGVNDSSAFLTGSRTVPSTAADGYLLTTGPRGVVPSQ